MNSIHSSFRCPDSNDLLVYCYEVVIGFNATELFVWWQCTVGYHHHVAIKNMSCALWWCHQVASCMRKVKDQSKSLVAAVFSRHMIWVRSIISKVQPEFSLRSLMFWARVVSVLWCSLQLHENSFIWWSFRTRLVLRRLSLSSRGTVPVKCKCFKSM